MHVSAGDCSLALGQVVGNADTLWASVPVIEAGALSKTGKTFSSRCSCCKRPLVAELDVPSEKKGVGRVTGPSPESGSLLYLPPCACGSSLICGLEAFGRCWGHRVWEVG